MCCIDDYNDLFLYLDLQVFSSQKTEHIIVDSMPMKMYGLNGSVPIRRIQLYCDCLMPEDVDDMVACDACERWFHLKCVGLSAVTKEEWLCKNCTVEA